MANPDYSNFRVIPCGPVTEHNEIRFHGLYLHHFSLGPSPTQSTIVSSDATTGLGETAVNDWPIYNGQGPSADIFARAQGLHVNARGWHNSFTMVFEDPRFRGSTLQVMGLSVEEGEWSIVGGTGQFAMARGIINKRLEEQRGDGNIIELTIHGFCPTLIGSQSIGMGPTQYSESQHTGTEPQQYPGGTQQYPGSQSTGMGPEQYPEEPEQYQPTIEMGPEQYQPTIEMGPQEYPGSNPEEMGPQEYPGGPEQYQPMIEMGPEQYQPTIEMGPEEYLGSNPVEMGLEQYPGEPEQYQPTIEMGPEQYQPTIEMGPEEYPGSNSEEMGPQEYPGGPEQYQPTIEMGPEEYPGSNPVEMGPQQYPMYNSQPTKNGPWGGNGGSSQDITEAPRSLESVTIRSGWVIDSIEFSYIDQTGQRHTAGPWGGSGNDESTIYLDPSELVKEVSGTVGEHENHIVITSLMIVTNITTYGP